MTGLVHLAIGFLAFSLLFTGNESGDESSIARGVAAVMAWPGGRWLVGLAGLVIAGAGMHYAHEGWKEKYRNRLQANHFTTNWNWLLKAGLVAHGVVIAIVGVLFMIAAWRADPNAAGGVGRAFSWLTGQPYGQALVAVICAGLLGFALFCFVSSAYRIVPRISGGSRQTPAPRLETRTRHAA